MVNSKSDTDYKKSFWRSKLFEFGNEVLTENRKKAHLTQKKVASVLDLDQSEVSRIERGITKPNDIITIESICDIYKLTPNQKREYLQLTCGITESINNDALLGLVDNQINFIANLNLSGYASLAIKQSQNLRAWLENNIDFT